ncbi:MAG: hypothetical protein CBC97_02740 [Verrucomicrobiaceae bacterium TMED137]|nr:MAG: hypothetical protein CBC97_02740 [Verrucomicrobiaceae bacterium TMED137]HAE18164.1 hypothetical protein [Verrucomicrobiales bacterium]|tara:strand:+ start:3731 stop:4768 length:1038 start_codon:yes stop_codon:yes gene_type:complete
MHSLVPQSLVSLLYLLPVVSYGQISDDFNDGFDEQSWQNLNPLKDFVDWAYFVNDSTYRMISGASPDPDALGQARIGAMRKDANYSAFRVGVDLAPFDPAIEQDVGVLARITSAGLGTTSGYAATIDTDESRIYIARIDLEQPTVLGEADSPLDPEKNYQLVFHGYEGRFLAEVFDVTNLTTPLFFAEGEDDTYQSGPAGLFGAAGQPDGNINFAFYNYESDDRPDVDQDGMPDPIEATFFGNLDQPGDADFDGDGRDNAQEIEDGTDPTAKDSSVKVISVDVSGDRLSLQFRTLVGRNYQLETSGDLTNWVVDTEAEFEEEEDGIAKFLTSRGIGRKFVRVVEP